MPFNNDNNRGRAQKMFDTLALILKSAEANNAPDEDIAALLSEVTQALSRFIPAQDPAPHPLQQFMHLSAGRRAALTLADQTSLRDLVGVLIARLETYVAQTPTGEGR